MRVSKKKRRHKSLMPEVTLTPLIDMALTLLIIFMVTAPIVQNGIKIDLPQGKSKEGGSQQELVVTLSKNNELYFNSFPVAQSDLVDAVKASLESKADTPVYVRADETISYGKVIEIVDQLKQANVKYVAMSTRPSTQS